MVEALQVERALDHVILGIADLDRGVEWIRQHTGITPIEGGRHPAAGTRNALISLGNHQYLEIMARDPEQDQKTELASLISGIEKPRLIAWAAATIDIGAVARRGAIQGYPMDGPHEGSRIQKDGTILRWQLLRMQSDLGSAIPFFIQWEQGMVHPSDASPAGCRLERFIIAHPEAIRVRGILEHLGIAAEIEQSPEPRMKALLSTPTGRITIE